MDWKRFIYFQHVPTAQASLALGFIGLGKAWALYFPLFGDVIRPFCSVVGSLLLAPVLIRYVTSPGYFFMISNTRYEVA